MSYMFMMVAAGFFGKIAIEAAWEIILKADESAKKAVAPTDTSKNSGPGRIDLMRPIESKNSTIWQAPGLKSVQVGLQ